jgi:hypothetical protein
MQIKKERKQTYRYSYTQLVAIKPAKAPGQDSIGTGGQNSIGANNLRFGAGYTVAKLKATSGNNTSTSDEFRGSST